MWDLSEEVESLGLRWGGTSVQEQLKGVTISGTLLSSEVGLGLVE